MNPQFWWYVARASGIVSWVLLAGSLAWGVTLSTRLLGKKAMPSWLLDLHRYLGALSVVFVGVHLAGLVADNYAHFGLADLLVPMASAWKPGPVAWGVAGVYLLIAVELTSLLKRRIPPKLWRATHYTSFPLYVLTTVHLLLAGTDRANNGLRVAAVSVSATLAFATIVRVLSPRSELRKAAPAADRVPRPVPVAVPAATPAPRPRPDRQDRAAMLAAARAARAAQRREADEPAV